MTFPDNAIPALVNLRNVQTMGYYQHEEQAIQEFQGKCFRDFLVLEFILMRVLKSGDDRGPVLSPFLSRYDNIDFGAKDQPL
ncbi:hypothetical protein Tco_1183515 [Tanacetum coccineum]